MKILVVNAGSSSLKYQVIDMDNEKLLAKGLVERIGADNAQLGHKVNGKETVFKQPLKNHAEALELVLSKLVDKEVGVLKNLNEISAIGHRVLTGIDEYNKSTLIDEKVVEDLKRFIPFAPLHMPANILGIEACQKVMPSSKNVAVFDTTFHSTMPDYAYTYAVPYDWYKNYKIRRYGFHGTSHEYIANELASVLGKDIKDLKIISCHIGSGASVCAIKYGKVIDTSMGFTPLEGLVMGTRSGDLDPAILEYVGKRENKDASEVLNVLNKQSGLLGISGLSNDSRDIEAAARNGDERSKLALECCYYRIKKYIGAYAAAMNGVDAIAFSAGCGENGPELRENVMKDMEYLGVDFDFDANNNYVRGINYKLSKDTSKVAVYIIPTNEELSIARQTKKIIESV